MSEEFGKWMYEKYQSLRLIHGLTEQEKVPKWEELTDVQREVFKGYSEVIKSAADLGMIPNPFKVPTKEESERREND
jgi:hypothetical protein